MATKKRILIADDHTILRSGLRLMLSSQPDLDIVGEASNGAETLQQSEVLHPDLILLDLSMPGMNGLDVLPTLRRLAPSAKILVLTMHDDKRYLHQALQNGASGYVLKKSCRYRADDCDPGGPSGGNLCTSFDDAIFVG